METRLRELDRQIEALTSQSVDPQTKALVESIPGFGALNAAKLLAFFARRNLTRWQQPPSGRPTSSLYG
jgi:transposase